MANAKELIWLILAYYNWYSSQPYMYYRLFFMGPVFQLTHLWSSLTKWRHGNDHHSLGGHVWLYILSTCIIYMGYTESGHCQKACRSQWFFCVPLQDSETAPPYMWSCEPWEIHSLQCWRVRNKSPEAYPACIKDWTWDCHMTGAHATTCSIATLAPKLWTLKFLVMYWFNLLLILSLTSHAS